MNTTTRNESMTAPDATTPPGPEETLAELTLCLSQAYTARSRSHLDRGDTDLALADLDNALRLDLGNTEALQVRKLVEQPTGPVPPAVASPAQSERHEPSIDGGIPLQSRFESGYQVMARCAKDPDGTGTPLGPPEPLTPRGRLHAIELAKRMCSDESSRERGLLYDAYLTGGEAFDAVVIEFRSLTREIYLEKALDEDGEPSID